jgi:aryl-alcohol dehydrogenase-like predicted oxidoreductase
VSEKACRKAFDEGVNYFFWGSVRTREMGMAIRDIARSGREGLIVVLECYARTPMLIRRSVERGLRSLQIDRVDVLLLGWHDRFPGPRVLEAVADLKERERFRFLGISSHDRSLIREFILNGQYDVVHLRYNAAHPGAEQDIFPYVPEEGRPGLVSFTNTRWGDLLKAKKMPPGTSPPSAPDCYRFVLSNPYVDVAICGPKNDQEMETALAVLKSGPMDEEERRSLCKIGDHVHDIRSIMSVLT